LTHTNGAHVDLGITYEYHHTSNDINVTLGPKMINKSHIFNMTQVTDSVWYNGYRAFLRGEPDTDNPHGKMSPSYFQWANGWNTARQDFIEHRSENANPSRPENSDRI
jgi:hypothetical protein